MYGFSTMTQKGQVAIPKAIRDYFKLKPSDKVQFSVRNNTIIVRKVSGIDTLFGSIPAKKPLSKKQMKNLIQKSVLEKYAHSS